MATQILGTLAVKLKAITAGFERDMKSATKATTEFSKGSEKLGVAAAAAFAGGAIAIGKMIGMASDMAEQMNVINTGFGDGADAVVDWAKTTSQSIGRSNAQILDFVGSTQAMLGPMTGNAEAAAEMSKRVAVLATDLGSFFNVADQDALLALKSGLTGASEPMRKFGVVMTVASLEAFALSKGIKTSVKDMSEAEKTALRYNFILERTTKAQGDAARTADGFANLTKKVGGQFTDLAGTMGQLFLPIAERMLKILSVLLTKFDNLSPAAQKFGAAIAGLAVGGSGLFAAFVGISKLMPDIIKAMGLMKVSMLKILAPVLLVATALTGIIGLFKTAQDVLTFRDSSASLVDRAKAFQRLQEQGTAGPGASAGTAFLAPFKRGITELGSVVSDITGDIDKQFADLGGDTKTIDNLFKTGAANLDDFNGKTKDAAEGLKEFDFSGSDLSGAKINLEGVDLGKGFETDEGKIEVLEVASLTVDPILENRLAAIDEALAVDEQDLAILDEAATAQAEAVKEGGERIADFQSQLADQLLGKLGPVGDTINAAMEGFSQGGPIGAAIAAITAILTNVESFGTIVEVLNELFGAVLEAVDPLVGALAIIIQRVVGALIPVVEGLKPIFEVLGKVLLALAAPLSKALEVAGKILLPIIEALTPLIELLGDLFIVFQTIMNVLTPFGLMLELFSLVIEFVSGVIKDVASFFKEVFQGIKTFIDDVKQEFAKFLRDIGLGGLANDLVRGTMDEEALAAAREFARIGLETGATLEETIARVNQAISGFIPSADAANQAMDIVNQMFDDAAGATDSMNDAMIEAAEETSAAMVELADTVAQVNDELTNVPNGFKIALARFRVAEGEAGVPPPGGVGNVFNITNTSIAETQALLDQRVDFDNFSDGSSTDTGEFTTDRRGS